MFEKICIQLKNSVGNENLENAIDFGFLAETMLFYKEVHIVTGHSFLKLLVKKFEPELFLKFLEAGFMKISYLENNTGIYTEKSGTRWEKHKPVLFSIPDYAWKNHSRKLFSEAIGLNPKGARRYSIQVSRYIKPFEFERSLETDTIEDLSNGKYVIDAVKNLLIYFIPDYELPKPFIFEVNSDGRHLYVETNIDFEKANKYYHQKISAKHSNLSPSYLLSNLMAVRADWYFSSIFESEIAIEPINNIICNLKFNDLISKREKSAGEIDVFQDFVYKDAKAISEAINSGEKTFWDLYHLLIEAKKFKTWLSEQTPDEKLIKAYFEEVTKTTWVDKLPPKTIRWSLLQLAGVGIDALGAGGIGTLIGLGLSASDKFLLDKILKGWKPNQFIETSKQTFLSKDKH